MKYLEDFLRFREDSYYDDKIEDRVKRLEDILSKIIDNLYGKELYKLSQKQSREFDKRMKEWRKEHPVNNLTNDELLDRLMK